MKKIKKQFTTHKSKVYSDNCLSLMSFIEEGGQQTGKQVCLVDLIAPGKNGNLSISFAALCLSIYKDLEEWSNVDEYNMISSALVEPMSKAPTFFASSKSSDIVDPRGEFNYSWPQNRSRPRVYTDHPQLLELIKLELTFDEVSRYTLPFHSRFDFVLFPVDADFVLTLQHTRNFLSIPEHQRICQFPYEGGLVRKDLLPLTVRKYCYKANIPPFWYLPCFDLSTEFHHFRNFYQEQQSNCGENETDWIIKPAQGSHALGHAIFPYKSTKLKDIAKYVYESMMSDPFDGDRVAQKLVSKPALIFARKMDLRVIVVVRSFEPFSAFMSETYYARLANCVYDTSDLRNPEVSMTVTCYDADDNIRERQERTSLNRLATALGLEDTIVDERSGMETSRYHLVEKSVISMLGHLFSSAAKGVGCWPRSCAYYAVDVILDWDWGPETDSRHLGAMYDCAYFKRHNIPIPRLLEVNFMGDLTGIEICLSGGGICDGTYREHTWGKGERDEVTAFHTWAAELVQCMLEDPSQRQSSGFIALSPPLYETEKTETEEIKQC